MNTVSRRHNPSETVIFIKQFSAALGYSLLIEDGAPAVPVAAAVHHGDDPGELVSRRLLAVDNPLPLGHGATGALV